MRVYRNIKQEIHERFDLREALNCLTTRQAVALVCLGLVPEQRWEHFIRDLLRRKDLALHATARLATYVTDVETLESLSVHPRAEVRFAVGHNPACPASIRRRLSKDAVGKVREGARSTRPVPVVLLPVKQAELDQITTFEEWWTYGSTGEVEDALARDPGLVARILAFDEAQLFARAYGQRDAPRVIAKRMTFDHLLRWAGTSRAE